MNTIFKALGLLVVAGVVLGDDEQLPKFDFDKCYSKEKLMKVSSEAEGCEWINDVNLDDYEKNVTGIFKCYMDRYKFKLSDGSFDVQKSLDAYDGFAVEKVKESMFASFKKCVKEVGSTDVIKVKQLCPVDK